MTSLTLDQCQIYWNIETKGKELISDFHPILMTASLSSSVSSSLIIPLCAAKHSSQLFLRVIEIFTMSFPLSLLHELKIEPDSNNNNNTHNKVSSHNDNYMKNEEELYKDHIGFVIELVNTKQWIHLVRFVIIHEIDTFRHYLIEKLLGLTSSSLSTLLKIPIYDELVSQNIVYMYV
jgi:hypothetical protein